MLGIVDNMIEGDIIHLIQYDYTAEVFFIYSHFLNDVLFPWLTEIYSNNIFVNAREL